ncbi:hypothetical protein [Citromicrobium bathyomarinum]|uniref:hypothetical protein n=1 Tax=Citromicrobium bathyomarinum TaxID=72174 RepID=UPI001E5DC810|nr:hypothetical protein [Citromicrobium bathyomarinum]MCD1622333.1 hypothetical protein [Citromicrobium bathyomarinum]
MRLPLFTFLATLAVAGCSSDPEPGSPDRAAGESDAAATPGLTAEPAGPDADAGAEQAAQAPDDDGYASAYTQLDLESCRVLDQSIDEGSWVELRCAGYQGIPLFVSEGDLRFDVDAGVPNENFQTILAFNTIGDTVEWRLREGAPFATIIRYRDVSSESGTRSVLAVDTIGQPGAPGCRVAQIAGDTPRANQRARAIADADAAGFDCANEPRYIGEAR